MTITSRLRDETRGLHEELMARPYFIALAEGRAELVSYVAHIRVMAVVHATLGHELSRAEHPAVASVWTADPSDHESLERDLAHFGAGLVPNVPSAIDEVLGLVATIRRRRVEDPASLLGSLYVLEDARRSAPTLRGLVARGFKWDESAAGLSYLSRPACSDEEWASFLARMDAAAGDEATGARIIEAAVELLRGLILVFGAIYPVTETRFAAAGLNPEAGAHPVVQDPRELCAAIRAGEACWAEFPYLAHRYGARGVRFTRSDSAWLATLVSLEANAVRDQVCWLGGLLAPRGIPRLVLQRHLEILACELGAELPARRARYAKLEDAARVLADARAAAIAPERFARLAGECDAALEPDPAKRIPRLGEIVIAAVQDERAGVVGAVEGVERWLTEPSRFTAGWCAAVRDALTAARASAR